MRKNKRSNKAGLVLMMLILVGYLFINLGEKVTFGNESVQAPVVENLPEPQQDSTNGSQEVEEEIIQEEPQAMIALIGEEYTVDITGEVEGWDDFWKIFLTPATCDAYDPEQGLDSTLRLCNKGGQEIPLDEDSLGSALRNKIVGAQNVRIDADTEIELTQVTYPLAFFLGQFVIKNSNREASIESPNYPSNGQIIDKNYTLKTHSPTEAEEYSEFFEETVRKDYEVTATINTPNEGGDFTTDKQEAGKYGITNVNDAKCACEEPEVSNSDYNPGSPNRQGSVAGGWARQQAPGLDNYEKPELNGCLALNKDYKMMLFGNVVACFDTAKTVAGKISGLFSEVFDRGHWENCHKQTVCTEDAQGVETCTTVEASEECTNTLTIGVQMTPIYGDPYECEEELCANAYLTNAYKAGLAPAEADSKMIETGNSEDSLMFFIGTPCKANITAGTTRNVGVTCLWDVSPYLLDYNLQKTFEAPNDEEFPSSFEVYWDLVMQAMELSADYYGLE
jgi:hypothetical protein